MLTTTFPTTPTHVVGGNHLGAVFRSAPKGCLIVSQVSEHLRDFQDMASETGWKPHVCHDVAKALTTMCKNSVQLAVIDFEDASANVEELQNLAEYIKWLGGILLIVNADPADEARERWARQVGVWTYMSGVPVETNLADLFAQARSVVEKLSPAPRNFHN